MIKIFAKMTIKQDMIGALPDSIPEFIALTRNEEGCISCQLVQDVQNRNVFIMVEEWESPEAHQKHLNSNHFQAEMKSFKEVQEKDMEVNICIQIA